MSILSQGQFGAAARQNDLVDSTLSMLQMLHAQGCHCCCPQPARLEWLLQQLQRLWERIDSHTQCVALHVCPVHRTDPQAHTHTRMRMHNAPNCSWWQQAGVHLYNASHVSRHIQRIIVPKVLQLVSLLPPSWCHLQQRYGWAWSVFSTCRAR